ncbi:MAG: hypothetical protein U9R42_11730 [Bacteroidota bacterium]|nr:hypothetical protein [Bacteroidota bacterium]
MKISRKDEYIVELQHILKYIASDKISASKQFKQKLDKQIKNIPNFPYKHRKSIYFDDDNVYVFANIDKQAVLNIYNIPENYCWKPVDLPDGKLKAVERFNNEFLFCIDENIYKYFISSNAVFPYLTDKACNLILNNYFNNEVYFIENNTIEIYNYSSGSYLNEVVFNDEILNVHLLYN